MKNKNLIIIVASAFIILTVGVSAALVLLANSDDNTENRTENERGSIDNDKMQNEDKMDKTESNNSQKTKGEYIEYNGSLPQANGKTQILFFHAAWCSTCNALDRDIKNNLDEIPQDIQIIKIDWEDEKNDLAKKYDVRDRHALVQLDEEGNDIQLWYGSFTLEDVIAKI